MKKNQKIKFGFIFAVGAVVVSSLVYWRLNRVNCCEPPIEVIQARNTVEELKAAWEGHWDYYVAGDDGYSQGVNLRLFVEDGSVAGEFDAVWSFSGAPAARLNNGTLVATSVKPGEITADWEGSREDKGQVVLRLSADKQVLTWEGALSTDAIDDGYALNGTRVFHRNQWVAWNSVQQTDFLQTVKKLLQEKKSNYTIQPGEDATIMVTGNYAVINTFIPNSPNEESGWVYLKKDNGQWGIVLGPKVSFSKTELDQASIPEVIRY